MLKRKSTILSVLVVASLSCSQTYVIDEANAEYKKIIRPGTTLEECKPLQLDPPIAIKIKRDEETLCAKEVQYHKSLDCSDNGENIDPISYDPKINPNVPIKAFSGSGNQVCPEAIVVYKMSPYCYPYTTGGNTYYIPPG